MGLPEPVAGIYVGWYEQDGKHHNMKCALVFFSDPGTDHFAGGGHGMGGPSSFKPAHVAGAGNDQGGNFTIEGTYTTGNDAGHMEFVKKYDNNVAWKYTGSFSGDSKIHGEWQTGHKFELDPQKIAPRADDPALHYYMEIFKSQFKKWQADEPSIFHLNQQKNLVGKNLSTQEMWVIITLGPSQWLPVLNCYARVYAYASQIPDDQTGEKNAKRHAFWMIDVVNTIGVDNAKRLGDAHEKGRPGTDEDNRVDEINNKVAIDYAQKHPHSDPRTVAEQLWNQGKLEKYRDGKPHHKGHDEL
eukprot:Phypoly_transcript_09700.p1 GENE.Phypoly_transcript_09700~~Phypoly_transcript_09700.p1  ORF type:complete len:300 (+),score=37.97 Phypoly_transcript_09700:274-1173(+)